MKQPTILDVAKRAGVSKSTVSHVLNSTRFVEEGTRQQVLQAIAQLDYHPSAVARSLTTKRTGTIGMVVSDATNLFFAEILLGVQDILVGNYGVIICNTDETLEREAELLEMLLRHRVEGIIAASTSQKWGVLAEAEVRRTPVVFVDRSFGNGQGPFVGVDNQQGAYLGTKHLIACGHRKIGIVAGFQRLSTMRQRLAGFRQALCEQGVPVKDEWIVESALSIEAGREATHKLLSLPDRPTALFVNNNLLSLGTLLAIQDIQLHCPQEIALVAFDDHPWAAVSNPPLTVVRQPARQIGQEAAQMLLMLLNGEPLTEPSVILPCELVLRQSC